MKEKCGAENKKDKCGILKESVAKKSTKIDNPTGHKD